MTTIPLPKCPSCDHTLEKIYLVSQCMQVARLDAKGAILSHSSPIVGDLLYVECPKCGQTSGLNVDNDRLKINGVFYEREKEQV